MSKYNESHYQDFTNLDQWLYYLENLHSTEIDLGLTRIQQVADRLAIDLSFATVITVAGTNGKGTTCAFLENALLDETLKPSSSINLKDNQCRNVAVYSSPHIERFNERLRINKVDVNDQLLINAFNQIELARKEVSLSYYEYTTLAAFLVLMVAKPDFIILEVGLGGRLDATNIIDADVAVITTIDLDHQAFLGNDRESIGFEKAGIMRSNQIIVVGDTNAPKSVLNHAYQVLGDDKSKLYTRNEHFIISETNINAHKVLKGNSQWAWLLLQSPSQSIEQLATPFIPRDNVATGLMVLTSLGFLLNSGLVNRIINNTKVAGRTELFNQKDSCDVILDVGHNPQASRYLAHYLQQLKQQGKYKRVHAVVAMLGDKDITNSLLALNKSIEHWYVGQLNVPRAAKASLMVQCLKDQAISSNMINCFDNVSDAFKIANKNANPDDLILVFGSFFTVSEIRHLLLLNNDRIDLQ